MYISKIVWTISAREDVHAIRQQIFGRDGRLGVERFKKALTIRLSLIQHFPRIGMANPDRTKIRKFFLDEYHDIVYEPGEDQIVIHGVLPNWKQRWTST